MRTLLFVLIIIGVTGPLSAQELRCNVVVNTRQIQENVQISDKQIFEDMRRSISEFMNNRRWTNDRFNAEEKINCNIIINITKIPAIGTFEANAQIQSSRPVYGTNYESILLSYIDRTFNFTYLPSQPMDFNENVFNNNLTAMLGFYAFVIIGLDYDSFGKLGGSQYMQKAMTIAQNGAQEQIPGWETTGDTRNRYWLIENLTNQQMQPIREGFYTYHRQAMDNFMTNPEQSRNQILEVLANIKQVNQVKPSAVFTNTFFDTKSNELINIFSDAPPQDRVKAYNLLVELDPTQTEKYRKLTK